jgi:predicted nucleic acid-binding protein
VTAYIDTSALVKLYVDEPGSAEFEAWLQGRAASLVSSLATVEVESALSRRLRMQTLEPDHAALVRRRIDADLGSGLFAVVPMADSHVRAARFLLRANPGLRIGTLDGLHLSIALAECAEVVATADAALAAAAEELGMRAETFGLVA